MYGALFQEWFLAWDYVYQNTNLHGILQKFFHAKLTSTLTISLLGCFFFLQKLNLEIFVNFCVPNN